jgi:hypothetical protein
MINDIIKKIHNNVDIIYINNEDFWQKPVITEQQIFSNLLNEPNIFLNYIAFPWANYIDSIHIKKYNIVKNIIDKEIINKNFIDNNKYYFTVVQHIHFRQYIDTFIKLNIKYIFTPHFTNKDIELEQKYNIRIFPIFLFPTQINSNNVINNKKYLVNFIGQIYHKDMINNIREKIYNNFNNKSNCFIQKNDNWFYQTNVYNNNTTYVKDLNYIKIMNESTFSLCPCGTGPNSIRLSESLSFGCIPVILSDNLVLPNIPEINYNDYFIIWKEENIHLLYDYLINIDIDTINKMSKNCIQLYNNYVSPKNLHKNILLYLNDLYI